MFPHKRVLIVALTLCAGLFAQDRKPSSNARDLTTNVDPWRDAADHVTADLLTLAPNMPGRLHAVLLARLCAEWWSLERASAQPRCEQAVEEVSHIAQDESDADRTDRIAYENVILRIVGPLDGGTRQRLLDAIATPPQSVGSQIMPRTHYDPTALGLSQLAAAQQSTDDPEKMASLIQQAIEQQAVGGRAIRALLQLRKTQPERADAIFRQAIGWASESSEIRLLASWANTMNSQYNSGPFPEEWMSLIMDALVRRVVSTSGLDQQDACLQFGSYLFRASRMQQPNSPALRSALDSCATPSASHTAPAPPADSVPQWPNMNGVKTADDFLRVANDSTDPRIRESMLFNAATRAAIDDKNFEWAVEILDEMTDEARKVRNYAYFGQQGQRQQWALQAAVAACARGDVKRALSFVDGSHEALRLNFSVTVANALADKKLNGVKDFLVAAMEVLRYRADDPNDYVKLVNVTSSLQPEQLETTLRRAVGELDQWRERKSNSMKPGEMWFQPLDHALNPLAFDQHLLRADRDMLRAVASDLGSVTLRASYDETLLSLFLEQSKREHTAEARSASAVAH